MGVKREKNMNNFAHHSPIDLRWPILSTTVHSDIQVPAKQKVCVETTAGTAIPNTESSV